MTDKIACKECGTLILSTTFKRTNGRCMPCFKKENPFWPLDPNKVDLIAAPTKEELIEFEKGHISEFNIDLRKILDRELAAGNNIVETSSGWPLPDSIFVMLEKPFVTNIRDLPAGLLYKEVNDPHYWKSEIFDEASRHILACRFDI